MELFPIGPTVKWTDIKMFFASENSVLHSAFNATLSFPATFRGASGLELKHCLKTCCTFMISERIWSKRGHCRVTSAVTNRKFKKFVVWKV